MASNVASAKRNNKCSTCKWNLQNPQTLPCSHKLCAGCLQQHILVSASTEFFNCPSCQLKFKRKRWEAPDGEVVQDSTGGGQVVDDRPKESTSQVVHCSNKDDSPATIFCDDCNEFYCEECAAHHRRFKAMRGHSTRPVDEMTPEAVMQAQTANTKTICTDHDQPLNIMCETCRRMICSTCALFDHKKHAYKELVKVAREAQKELESIVVNTAEYIIQQGQSQAEMRTTRADIRTSVKTARQSVKEAAQRMRDIINTHEKDLLLDLDRHEAEMLSKLDSAEKQYANNITSASAFKQEVENLCQSGKAVEKIMRMPILKEHVRTRTKAKKSNIKMNFHLNNSEYTQQSIKDMLGNVSLKSHPVVNPGEVTLAEPVHRMPLKCGGSVQGMVSIGDCLCVIHWSDSNLWLYATVSGRSKMCPVPGLKDPRGIAVVDSANRSVVITGENSDGNRSTLHFVKISTKMHTTLYRVKTILRRNLGAISVARETGELLVICERSDTPKFLICNGKGDFIKEITVEDVKNETLSCVIKTESGYVTTATGIYNHEAPSIHWLDKHSKSVDKISWHGGDLFDHPHHMVMDSQERLVVVLGENQGYLFDDGHVECTQLHLVDPSSATSQLLLPGDGGELRDARCVYLDEESERLYVAHRESNLLGSEILVYRWPLIPANVITTNFELELKTGQMLI